jgi:hypothetical protein
VSLEEGSFCRLGLRGSPNSLQTPAELTTARAKRGLRLHGRTALLRCFDGFSALFCQTPSPDSLGGQHHLIVLGDQVVGSIISAIVLLRVIVNFYVGLG